MEGASMWAKIFGKLIGTRAETKTTGTYFDKDAQYKLLIINEMIRDTGHALLLAPEGAECGPMPVLPVGNLISRGKEMLIGNRHNLIGRLDDVSYRIGRDRAAKSARRVRSAVHCKILGERLQKGDSLPNGCLLHRRKHLKEKVK